MLLRNYFSRSPLVARVAPFVTFVLLTCCQGMLGPESAFWIYFAKTLVGIWLICEMWPLVTEMRWAFSWEAVVVGVAIFAVWVGVSGAWVSSEWTTQNSLWIKLGLSHVSTKPALVWNPEAVFAPGLAWFFIIVRILGAAFVVPPLEETFY